MKFDEPNSNSKMAKLMANAASTGMNTWHHLVIMQGHASDLIGSWSVYQQNDILTIERPGFNRLNHFGAAKKVVWLEFCYKQLVPCG